MRVRGMIDGLCSQLMIFIVHICAIIVLSWKCGLLVGTPPQTADVFVRRMLQGFPSHGCKFNTVKTCLNFDIMVDGQILPHNVYTSADG